MENLLNRTISSINHTDSKIGQLWGKLENATHSHGEWTNHTKGNWTGNHTGHVGNRTGSRELNVTGRWIDRTRSGLNHTVDAIIAALSHLSGHNHSLGEAQILNGDKLKTKVRGSVP